MKITTGNMLFPYLIKIAEETQNNNLRKLAINYLSQNAQRRIINPYSAEIDEKTKAKRKLFQA